jgi:predicted nucleotidyltransferase
MPVRSSDSYVLRWPDRDEVEQAAREWAIGVSESHPDLLRLGFFGSYARGDWGVGSDLDLIAVVTDSAESFDKRGLAFDVLALPVPAEILVYTQAEIERLQQDGRRFARVLAREVVWLFES